MTSTGIGETIGPIISSVLNDQYGFTLAQDYWCSILLCYVLLYFFFGGGIDIFKRSEDTKLEKVIAKQNNHVI